jgi:hypothetical protein
VTEHDANVRQQLANQLAPANFTLHMTGSKSGRALDNLDNKTARCGGLAGARVKAEERPRKKRRSSINTVNINVIGLPAFDQIFFSGTLVVSLLQVPRHPD